MRIVYPVNWAVPRPDAAQEQTVQTLSALARAGADVTLVLPRRPEDPLLSTDAICAPFSARGGFATLQIPSSRFAERRAASLAWWLRCARVPAIGAAELVLTRVPFALLAGAGPGRPFLFDHFRPWPDEHPRLRPLYRRTLNGRDCVGLAAHSELAAASFRRSGVDPERILVARNGYDPVLFEPRLSRDAARAALGLDRDRPLAVYAGRIAAWKSLETLIDLARRRPGVDFLLLGSEGAGPVEAAAAGLPNLRLVPILPPDRLPLFLFAADLLLVPPSREPLLRHRRTVLPMKVFLYLAAGRPILAPRLPDIEELLVDGRNGLLVEPDDGEAAAAGLDRLLADPALGHRLSAAALDLSGRLTWDHRARRMLDFVRARMERGR